MAENQKSWTEYFRFLTPMLVTVAIFILGNIMSKVNSIDEKMFKHLTNDELHCPRSIMLAKSEFDIYQNFRSKEMLELRDEITEMKKNQLEHFKISYENNMKLQQLIEK